MLRFVFALPLAAIGLMMAVASCEEGSHSYNARKFDRARRCLGPMESLDSVSGNEPGQDCAIKCLVPQSTADGGEAPVYISQMCPPYPPFFDTSGLQPGCSEAIAAGERGDICLADGGSTDPPPDSGADASDAGTGAIDGGTGSPDGAIDASDSGTDT